MNGKAGQSRVNIINFASLTQLMVAMTTARSKRKTVWIFVGLAFVFMLPIIGAHLLYKYGRGYLLKNPTQYGALLQPPVNLEKLVVLGERGKPVEAQAMRGKWLLLYIYQENTCQKACMEHLYFMRQIRVALGKEGSRLANWFLTLVPAASLIEKERLETRLDIHYGQISQQMLKSLFTSTPYASMNGFYLVDPLGNLIMAYPEDENPNHILKDLKRLLKASRIG